MRRFLRRGLTENYLRWFWLGGFLLVGISIQSLVGGCSQCVDSSRATSPAVEAYYGHSILLLGSIGACFFIAGTFWVGRTR